jgi:2-hydroxymuconate-semialdehyde hydrolase
MHTFAFDAGLVKEEIVRSRYEASIRPGAQEAYTSLFPEPRQRWLDAQTLPIHALQGITHPTLLVHGRDDRVVDPMVSWNLHQHLPNSQLHTIAKCGHWTMIEHGPLFRRLVADHCAA